MDLKLTVARSESFLREMYPLCGYGISKVLRGIERAAAF